MKIVKWLLPLWLLSEIFMFWLVATLFDGGTVLLVMFVTAIAGFWVLSKNKVRGAHSEEELLRMMQEPGALIKRLKFSFAGVLLIIPGILTDLLALLILSPLSKMLVAKLTPMASMMGGMGPMGGMGGQNQAAYAEMLKRAQGQNGQVQGDVIEGEYKREEK